MAVSTPRATLILLLLRTTLLVSAWSSTATSKIAPRYLSTRLWSTAEVVALKAAPDSLNAVLVRCPSSGRQVDCFWDWCLTVGSRQYLVLHPMNEAVAICRIDGVGEMEPLDPDSVEMDAIFSVAAALFDEDGLRLNRSPTVLTIEGELGDGDEGDNDEYSEDQDDALDAADEIGTELGCGDGDDDLVELLAEFEIEDDAFALVRLLDPVYFIAEPAKERAFLLPDSPGECVLLNEGQSEQLAPIFEQALLEREERGLL
jgi:hypothetical protein